MVDTEPWNLAVHEDKQPNPTEVLLTAQNLSCRYHEIFNEADSLDAQRRQQNADQIPIGGQWQLIVKLAGAKRKRAKRSAYAYEARIYKEKWCFVVLGAVLLDLLQVQFRR
ncbi:hypothetical protein SO802_010484 [Lithocarpus litseifolius]|uniref:Uncharacterized protein n=1 Tax=Lithocarpus litseifolius TaxID=425828 RepID=A0AAW2DEV4_9ROSI